MYRVDNNWDFPVNEQPIYFRNGNGAMEQIPTKKAIVREDTDSPLAVVSNGYKLVTYKHVLDKAEEFVKHFGEPTRQIHIAAKGGRMMAVYDFKNKPSKMKKVGDEIGLRLRMVDSYNTTTGIKLGVGGLRLLCLNGMVGEVNYTQQNFRHNASGVENLSFPEPGAVSSAFNYNLDLWSELATLPLTVEASETLMGHMQENVIVPASQLESSIFPKLEDIAKQDNGTAWDAYNVLTENITHVQKGNEFTKTGRLKKTNDFFMEHYALLS